jgi:hypothetical protein
MIYGEGVEPKPDGIFRLAYGNKNSFPMVSFNNPKANLLNIGYDALTRIFLQATRHKSIGILCPAPADYRICFIVRMPFGLQHLFP